MVYTGYHTPLVVGSGTPYFIVKNSWGTGWGEDLDAVRETRAT